MLWETTKDDPARVGNPSQYLYGSWYGIMRNYLSEGDATEEVSPAVVTTNPAQYTLYSPHGKIDLPTDGYWPTLFPESVLEGMFLAGQPVKSALSFNGDGMMYTEEGSVNLLGGYQLGPGPSSFFIGGA